MPRYDIPKAAPDELREVQLFINSVDLHNEVEWLPQWLDERGCDADYERACRLREALRALVLANNGLAPDPPAVETVNRELASVRLAIDRSARPVIGADGGDAIDQVVTTVAAAMLTGNWRRLKACRNCQWCFYDYSPNHSARWCSMQLCGNRKKTREYRRRRRLATG